MDLYVSDSGLKSLRALTSLQTSKLALAVSRTASSSAGKKQNKDVVLDKDAQ